VGVRVREVAAGTDQNSPRLEVIPAGGPAGAAPVSDLVPLGHQEGAGATCDSACPASVVGAGAVGRARLAAVALVVDPEACTGGGAVLLTRRPRSMRSFPGAWVLPGGGVDSSDAGVSAAAVRELKEETGLRIIVGGDRLGGVRGGTGWARVEAACFGTTRLLCLWESCYPVRAAAWAQAVGGRVGSGQGEVGGVEAAGVFHACSILSSSGGAAAVAAGVVSAGVVRPRHHLVVYVHVVSPGAASLPLSLQPTECDAACWVRLSHVRALLRGETEEGAGEARSYAMAAGGPVGRVAAEQLRGVYPNHVGEGIGRGHCFALHTLLSLAQEGGEQ
jgi:8-oxo-dGTP pyrophosphatase MutT (NUDIX family)